MSNNNNNYKKAGSIILRTLIGKLSLTTLAIIGAIVVVIVIIVASIVATDMGDGGFTGGGQHLPDSVLVWEDDVLEALEAHGLGAEYLYILLAIMYQESKGDIAYSNGDIFQASESKCGYIGCITDPIESIEQGVKHFKSVLQKGESKGVDLNTIIQAYNMGSGFIDFVARNGGEYSEELAQEFALKHARRSSCGWRTPYCYGDYTYVSKVTAFIPSGDGEWNGATAIDEEVFKIIMDEAVKYQGYPYTWGGAHPSTSFDCSGFTQWVYGKAGINLPRTSYEQYRNTKKINKDDLKAGDLIFFKTASYNPVTHVGIYVGNNRMFDANNSGIGYTDLNNYWSSKIVGYGRVN